MGNILHRSLEGDAPEEEKDNKAPEGDKDDKSKEGDESEDESIPDGVDPIEYWKEKAKKSKDDLENYKSKDLSEEASKRKLKEGDAKATTQTEKEVISVLNKQNEQNALKAVVNSKSNHYIPELVPDNQYNEIIQYLPRIIDKSSIKSIVKALKIAVRTWKAENGVEDDKDSKTKKNDLYVSKTKHSSSGSKEAKKEGRTFIQKGGGMETWFPKKSK